MTKHTVATSEQVIGIYKCLCDLNRLRILNLLSGGPRCVCELEWVLGIGPVRTSQHLDYLRKHGMVEVAVRGTWRVYSLPEKKPAALDVNLACLQDGLFENAIFHQDRRKLESSGIGKCGPAGI